MKRVLIISLLFMAMSAVAQTYPGGKYVLLRVPQYGKEVTYEVVPRQEYPARQKQSRMINDAVNQAYEDIKDEWTEERREDVSVALQKSRTSNRNRTRSSRNRDSFRLSTFPLKPPESMTVSYLGSFASTKAAHQSIEKIKAREKMTGRSQLARPDPAQRSSTSRSRQGSEVKSLSKELNKRIEALLADIASGDTKNIKSSQGMAGPKNDNTSKGLTGPRDKTAVQGFSDSKKSKSSQGFSGSSASW